MIGDLQSQFELRLDILLAAFGKVEPRTWPQVTPALAN
jgi:hypothetical protein